MAQRRMFSLQIVDSDAFLDMPQSSQLLYFHLSMRADDDGFVSNPKKIARVVGANDDDIKVLFTKRFLLAFESGVVVIKHWRIHNLIRGDRYNETKYIDEKASLQLKENGSYTELDTAWQPDGNQMAPQVRLGKVRIGKDSIGETEPQKVKYGQFGRVKLLSTEYDSLQQSLGDMPLISLITELDEYIESIGKDKYKSHYATIQAWARRKMQDHHQKLMSKGKKIVGL